MTGAQVSNAHDELMIWLWLWMTDAMAVRKELASRV